MARTFLTAAWRKLLMAQYEVPAETLLPFLPPGLTLDLFHGRCFVSLIGFLFEQVRILGLPIPFHTRFEEVNLRFYVLRTEPDGTRKRGVVFIREFVPLPAITLVANALYEEPYATCRMGHRLIKHPDSQYIEYGWKQGATWHTMAADASLTAEPILPGSIEEFITEHYWGYTRRTRGRTSEYAVRHPRWLHYPVLSSQIQADFGALYGPAFASLNAARPAGILLAEGSDVSVSTGSRLPPPGVPE